MSSYVDVRFRGRDADPSVESAVHRWVARFEAMRIEVQHASITVEPSWRRTTVCVSLELVDGTVRTGAATHADVYVAVAAAFRNARQEMLGTAEVRTRHVLPRFARGTVPAR